MIKNTIKVEGDGLDVSKYIDTFDPSKNDYKISNTSLKKIKILAGDVLSEDIFANLNISDCTFLLVTIEDVNKLATVNSAKFNLSIDNNIVCEASQFYIANCSLFFSTLNIVNIASVNDTYLTIIVGLK